MSLADRRQAGARTTQPNDVLFHKTLLLAMNSDIASPQHRLDELIAAIATSGVDFFPIRHHSPACAWHLRRRILDTRPDVILIEGPAEFTPLIPLILHPDSRTPFAIYASFVDKRRSKDDESLPAEPERYAAFYPFCDYSPELVALRTGSSLNAELEFFDLSFAGQMRSEGPLQRRSPQARSLLAENRLARSRYIQELARRSGCRDANELWDSLFEAQIHRITGAEFVRQTLAYCLMARLDYSDEEMEADGTLARERAMAAAIRRRQRERPDAKLLIVTGGFHSANLPFLLQGAAKPAKGAKVAKCESTAVLIRYSFDRLDALNGYAAGMPAPRYYDLFWRSLESGDNDPWSETAGSVLVEIGRQTRTARSMDAVSTADAMTAFEHAIQLARLRNHPGSMREDVLDAVRNSFVKGSLEIEGAEVMRVAREVFCGREIGNVPAEAGAPPLVEDFRRLAAEFKLKISDTAARKTSLDIYRSNRHRRISRFYHSLDLLNVAFAEQLAGPDFATGEDLELIQERWEYRWSAETEAGLVDASILGATIEEATVERIKQAIAEMAEQGESRSVQAAVRWLVVACRTGVHRSIRELIERIAACIAEDPSFVSLVRGLLQLTLLWQAREPLDARDLAALPSLAKIAFERACFLTSSLSLIADDQSQEAIRSLASLRAMLAQAGRPVSIAFDSSLFEPALTQLASQTAGNAAVIGAANGVLHSDGLLTETILVERVRGFLDGTAADPARRLDVLRGVLSTCREAAWRSTLLLVLLNDMIASWDDAQFVETLPHLRLAFSSLTPRETDRVAQAVVRLGQPLTDDNFAHDILEADSNESLAPLVAAMLHADGLDEWTVPSRADAPSPLRRGTTGGRRP